MRMILYVAYIHVMESLALMTGFPMMEELANVALPPCPTEWL